MGHNPTGAFPGTTNWWLDQFGVNHTASELIDGSVDAFGNAVDSLGNIIDPLNQNLGTPTPFDYTLGQSSYDFTQRVFPSDLGSSVSYNGHYVVINIAVQQATRYTKIKSYMTPGGGSDFELSTILTEARSGQVGRTPSELSKTDVLRYNIDDQFADSEGFRLGLGSELGNRLENRPRYTRRIRESIALYMPNSEMTFTDAHGYDDISLTKFATGAASGTLSLAAAGVAAFSGGVAVAGNVGGLTNDLIGGVGQFAGTVSQLGGMPINPKVEILYANTFQREFSFDFLMAPSTPEESLALQQIIRTLRFHAAPERRAGVIESFFWLPPSEFDITFYNRGVENTNVPRINTCVLKQIDVSYAPTGVYATFSNGHPVQVRMVLRFAETSVNDKLKVLQGF